MVESTRKVNFKQSNENLIQYTRIAFKEILPEENDFSVFLSIMVGR
jgi:hypothetical protein